MWKGANFILLKEFQAFTKVKQNINHKLDHQQHDLLCICTKNIFIVEDPSYVGFCKDTRKGD